MIASALLFSRLALRNLWRNPRRSILTAAAIAFGLSCLIVFGALKRGLHEEMRNSTVGLETGAVQVHASGYEPNVIHLKPINGVDKLIDAIKDANAEGYSRRIKMPALVVAGEKSSTVLVSGVDPKEEPTVTFISSRVVQGSYVDGGLLIGQTLADSLGLSVGQGLGIMAYDMEGLTRGKKFPVTGIYRTELASFDRSHIYMPLEMMREFLRAEGVITEVAVAGDEALLNSRLRQSLPESDFQVRTWEEIAPDVKQIIDLNDATMRLLAIIVFAIVALGIANTMGMAIFERFREFGILSAIGTTPGTVLTLVLLESFYLGLIASLAGSALGMAACLYLGEHGIDLSVFTSANQYMAVSHVLRAKLVGLDMASANALTIATSVLAGCFPALKASRLRPVDAITHT